MGVRDRGFIFAQGILPAAVAAVALLTRFARNPTTAGLAIHHLKSISNAIGHFSEIPKILGLLVPFSNSAKKRGCVECEGGHQRKRDCDLLGKPMPGGRFLLTGSSLLLAFEADGAGAAGGEPALALLALPGDHGVPSASLIANVLHCFPYASQE